MSADLPHLHNWLLPYDEDKDYAVFACDPCGVALEQYGPAGELEQWLGGQYRDHMTCAEARRAAAR